MTLNSGSLLKLEISRLLEEAPDTTSWHLAPPLGSRTAAPRTSTPQGGNDAGSIE